MIPFSLGHIAKRDESVPASVDSLKLWLDASQEVTTDANGKVSSWGDISGNFYTYQQATEASRPALVANVKNGLPGLLFDGADDFLITTNGLEITRNIKGLTSFAVISSSVAAARCYWSNSKNGSNSPRINLYLTPQPQLNAVSTLDSTSYITRTWASPSVANNEIYALSMRLDYVTPATAAWKNTTLGGSVSGGQIGQGSTSDSNSNNSRIGSTSSGGNFFGGYLLELIVYNRTLTNTEVQTLQNYLINKYLL